MKTTADLIMSDVLDNGIKLARPYAAELAKKRGVSAEKCIAYAEAVAAVGDRLVTPTQHAAIHGLAVEING